MDPLKLFYGTSGTDDFEFEWQAGPTAVTKRKRGTTGWAIVRNRTHRSPDGPQVGAPSAKVHLCAECPCSAQWDVKKYGSQGICSHFQPSDWRPSLVAAPGVALASAPGAASASEPSSVPSGAPAPESAPGLEAAAEAAVAHGVTEPPFSDPPLGTPIKSASEAAAAATPSIPLSVTDAAVVSILEPAPVEALAPGLPPCEAPPLPPPDGPPPPPTIAALGLAGVALPMPMLCTPGKPGGGEAAVAAPAAQEASQASLQSLCSGNVLARILDLSRTIRRYGGYVGHAAFLLFGLLRQRRPIVWEGENPIDLIDTYAPWAVDRCAKPCVVDAITCCQGFKPVSESHPLHKCNHWLAGAKVASCEPFPGPEIEAVYSRLGVVVMGTVVDGNCGIDVMLQMEQVPTSPETIDTLRRDLSDYLVERAGQRWMQELLAACQEVTEEDFQGSLLQVGMPRTLGSSDAAPATIDVDALDGAPDLTAGSLESTRPSAGEAVDADQSVLAFKALQWASSSNDDGVALSLQKLLPPAVVQEQIQLYLAREAAAGKAPSTAKASVEACGMPLMVLPHLLKSRMQAAARYEEHLQDHGLEDAGRVPRGVIIGFIKNNLLWTRREHQKVDRRPIALREWHKLYKNNVAMQGKVAAPGRKPRQPKFAKGQRTVGWDVRKRFCGFQGRPRLAPMVREQLYDWFISMRFSINWKRYNNICRSRGAHKCIGRFPKSMLNAKLRQLLTDYCHEMLVRGIRPRVFNITSKWHRGWESEYGVTMKAPTRKYKVPAHVLEERCEIGWLNAFRVRAACEAIHGYDPEMENFDQSPFHANETGSKNVSTLAVAGLEVPLVEGHADTRERWTGNFTTFSDKQRILAGETPYVEVMLKSNADSSGGRQTIELRVREHIRSRGYGPWMTVATSPKGSYREADVLNFLDKHLPLKTEGRPWRIMFNDDFAAHKTDAVFRLCWSRGYVLVTLGGGVTPVQQTVDLDLNQHVRREYCAAEAEVLISMMRDGVVVPSLRPENCVDLLHGVMSKQALHLAAADSYEKAGWKACLDNNKRDHFIVREAGKIWNARNMREKVNAAVAAVRDEVAARRLKWTPKDIRRLITPYPKHRAVDRTLQAAGRDAHVGDDPEDDEGVDDAGEAGDSEDEAAVAAQEALVLGGAEIDDDEAAVAAQEALVVDGGDAPVDNPLCVGDLCPGAGATIVETAALSLNPAQAVEVQRSQELLDVLENSRKQLIDVGAVHAAGVLENDIRKEKRRMREVSRVDPDVLLGLARAADVVRAAEEKRRLAIEDANRSVTTRQRLRQEIKDAEKLLKKRKDQIAEQEQIAEARHVVKMFRLDFLGDGQRGCGGAAGRKRREEVLERMAQIGSGLSPQQRNDWVWFREAWERKMHEEHGDEWVKLFVGWVQGVLNQIHDGTTNAFSMFVYTETVRCFGGVLGLVLPS